MFPPLFLQLATLPLERFLANHQIHLRGTAYVPDDEELHCTSHPDTLPLLRFSDAKQRHIKKAMRNGLRADTMDAEAFYEFCCSAHEKRGEKNILSKELVLRCISAALSRGNGKIIAIKDKEEKVHSALFLCWDKESAYYLIPATLPEYKTSGASSLLVWEAFQEAQRQNLQSFDFEGSMEENIENSYRQYGAEQTPYFKISKGLLSHFL